MHLNQWMKIIATGLICSGSVIASGAPMHEQLQVPHCLAEKITTPYTLLAQNKQFKVIDVLADDVERLVLLSDEVHCGHFINITHQLAGQKSLYEGAQKRLNKQAEVSLTQPKQTVSYTIKHEEEVNAAISQVVSDNIWQNLNHLTSFHNRSATKDTGVQTANWLKAQFDGMAIEFGRQDTSSFFVQTGWYKQPSLVTVIGKDIKAPAVVIGAHMDTLDGRMPGAGDDGSGSSSVMEAARVLLSSHVPLKHPVYIIWYAAEERGLVGSQYVVEHFMKKSIPVKAVAQFDMTGYRVDAKDPTMWVYTDYTDKGLSHFVAKLIDTYVHVPVDYSSCGYGCSDHASWSEQDIPAAFPCESNFDEHNPYIHTSSDTMEHLSLEHMTNFSKLALAFVIELALD